MGIFGKKPRLAPGPIKAGAAIVHLPGEGVAHLSQQNHPEMHRELISMAAPITWMLHVAATYNGVSRTAASNWLDETFQGDDWWGLWDRSGLTECAMFGGGSDDVFIGAIGDIVLTEGKDLNGVWATPPGFVLSEHAVPVLAGLLWMSDIADVADAAWLGMKRYANSSPDVSLIHASPHLAQQLLEDGLRTTERREQLSAGCQASESSSSTRARNRSRRATCDLSSGEVRPGPI